MQGILIYPEGSPFKRTRRAEYRYAAVSVEADEPYAPLIAPEADAADKALVLVPDIYMVWPEVGAATKAEDYSHALQMLEEYMDRSCSRRLPPRLCPRVTHAAVPWSGEMGGWRFNAAPGDHLLHALAAAASLAAEALEARPRPRRVYILYSEEQHPAQHSSARPAALLAAAALQATLVELTQDPQPYPRPRQPPLVETHEYRRIAPQRALRLLLAESQAEPPQSTAPLTPRGPRARLPRLAEEAEALTLYAKLASLAHSCQALAAATAACTAPENPVKHLAAALAATAKAYNEATRLHRRRVGGRVDHASAANHQLVLAAAAGAAASQALRQALARGGADCSQAPAAGLTAQQLQAVLETLSCSRDATPPACIEETGDGRTRLRRGCLRRLREAQPPARQQP